VFQKEKKKELANPAYKIKELKHPIHPTSIHAAMKEIQA
jgi:hypothetical protein